MIKVCSTRVFLCFLMAHKKLTTWFGSRFNYGRYYIRKNMIFLAWPLYKVISSRIYGWCELWHVCITLLATCYTLPLHLHKSETGIKICLCLSPSSHLSLYQKLSKLVQWFRLKNVKTDRVTFAFLGISRDRILRNSVIQSKVNDSNSIPKKSKIISHSKNECVIEQKHDTNKLNIPTFKGENP